LAGFRIERDQVAVGCFEKQPVAVHPESAVADMEPACRLPGEMPQLASAARVHSPGVIGSSEVQDAIDLERRGLDLDAAASPRRETPRPREIQRVHVRLVDLLERAKATPGVIAVIGRPGVGGRLKQFGGIERLRGQRARKQQRCENRPSHLSVPKYVSTSCSCLSVYWRSSCACAASGSPTSTLIWSRGNERK